MTRRLGPKGQVVLPKKMRDALGLAPGDEVDFAFDGVSVRVTAAGPPSDWRRWRGSSAGHSLLSDLAEDRATERARETGRENNLAKPTRRRAR